MSKELTPNHRDSSEQRRTSTPLSFLQGMQEMMHEGVAKSPHTVLLCDASESMGWEIDNEHGTSLAMLKYAMSVIAYQLPEGIHSYWFNDEVIGFDPTNCEELEAIGTTNLQKALTTAQQHYPYQVYVISDGIPNDPTAALIAARRLGCPISSLFCGSQGNQEGIAFMQLLASQTNGEVSTCDLRKVSTDTFLKSVRTLLALPGK